MLHAIAHARKTHLHQITTKKNALCMHNLFQNSHQITTSHQQVLSNMSETFADRLLEEAAEVPAASSDVHAMLTMDPVLEDGSHDPCCMLDMNKAGEADKLMKQKKKKPPPKKNQATANKGRRQKKAKAAPNKKLKKAKEKPVKPEFISWLQA